MAWFERHFAERDRVELGRLAELHGLMKRWHDQLPFLPFATMEEFSGRPEHHLGENTAEEWLEGIAVELRARLQLWEKAIRAKEKENASLISRALRLTEEEALRYTSEQWKKVRPEFFPSVFPVFSAYRETPFYSLFRDAILMVRQTTDEVTFTTGHPMMEMEIAWMRGFVTYMRPSIIIESKTVGGRSAFHWREN